MPEQIRTFCWDDQNAPNRLAYYKKLASKKNAFLVGNAGDLLSGSIIQHAYKLPHVNVKKEGHRLLLVGSVFHFVKPGDIACGIGVREGQPVQTDCRIMGLRGPLSYETLKSAGYDMSECKFLYDPGLMIRELAPATKPVRPRGQIFIPHYRERFNYLLNTQLMRKRVSVVSIDATPEAIAHRIRRAELVYTSSLHGVVFAHSLGVPCVFVRPQTGEPMFKYQDYYASIGVPYPTPADNIAAALSQPKPDSPTEISYRDGDIQLPSKEVLQESGALEVG
ncbi:polysaccharide pyruvyl transferase family protein [Aeoliella mucimassa]|uniref:Polysaccharide pyruvyl transferase n=1 Tax=Aeoliella mucimassa TaxID=2527972 RepID=A0A518AGY2_9BACT|nr:polysaccharide pyruvyl transferase family protein [Aeoliella mucimassa]QDU53962.1 Polysaccharide pyruvyl transferase [Aeoliella mucimassa]